MTEQEWLTCTDPRSMLDRIKGIAHKRKLMLFSCGCCQRIWDLLPRKESRHVVEMLGLYADRLADEQDLMVSANAADEALRRIKNPAKKAAVLATSRIRYILTMNDASMVANYVASHAREARKPGDNLEGTAQCMLLRCIFGIRFRPVTVDPAWVTFTVSSLAQGIYDERAFDRLPILADALEDAGCDNADILQHCRSEGPHVRGCWPVDLILGKT